MPNLTSSEDIPRQQARLAALDSQKAAALAKHVDSAGLLDLSLAAANANNEILRLSGPQGRGED